MPLYRYVKAKPKKQQRHLPYDRILSTILTLTGLSLIAWVAYPIVSFEIMSRVKFNTIISAVPDKGIFSWDFKKPERIFGVELAPAYRSEVLPATAATDTTETDFTQISNWLPTSPQQSMNLSGRVYYLSIPKLRIDNAVVKIAGEDLNKTLIHYGGTGLPGEYGNTVIFGHSILPQFYDPKNYKSIFSLLPTLERNDEIFIKYDGVTYRYVVFDMRVTTPEDISILEQRYDASYLSLITCVPPGTYWKRLQVKTRLERL